MYRLLIYIALLALLGCDSTSDGNNITLFNDIAFSLERGEQVKNIEEDSKDRYLELVKVYPVQIPLYKQVHHEQYALFIGIPFNTSIDELMQHTLFPADSVKTMNKTDSTSYIYRKYYRNNEVYTEYIRRDFDNLVYVLNLTTSDSISEQRFSKEHLRDRFAENKQ